VAAIVAFADGAPDRKRYRNFHVKNVSGGDDYGAMREVLLRRFRRGKTGDARWELPDLLVVDGGKGQLGIAQAALDEIGIDDLPVAALAKEKETGRGERVVDRVYLPGRMNAIELRDGGGDLMMLAHARDEAHRASNLLRDKLGRRRRLQSGLDAVSGVGPRTRAILLKALGSMRAIEQADAEALVEAGATRRQAQAIVAHFSTGDDVVEDGEQQAVDNAFNR
jgi:excinuclease ABC subunit C